MRPQRDVQARSLISTVLASSLAAALAVGQLGCESGAPGAGIATSAPKPPRPGPAQTVAPMPTTTPEAAAPAAKPRDCGSGPELTFDDPVWEKQIRVQVAKPEGPVLKADVGKIKTMNVAESKKNDFLDPCIVPLLTSVKGFYLAPGNLEDISLLAKLANVESLRLSVTKVKDLSPLSGLKKLDRLDLGRTPVKDLKPLAALGNLTELQLDATEVEDLSPLSGMKKLEVLDIKNTRVSDLSPLKGLENLKTLYIAGSKVEDISPVKGLPKLKIVQQ